VRSLFGLTDDERLLGWINIGPPSDRPKKQTSQPPDLDQLVSVLDGADGSEGVVDRPS
jgi:hypothetical protein